MGADWFLLVKRLTRGLVLLFLKFVCDIFQKSELKHLPSPSTSSLTQSPVNHSLIYFLVHSFPTLTLGLTSIFIGLFIHSLHSFDHSFVHSFIHSFIQSIINSIIYLFIHFILAAFSVPPSLTRSRCTNAHILSMLVKPHNCVSQDAVIVAAIDFIKARFLKTQLVLTLG